jgi:hypothetical protein
MWNETAWLTLYVNIRNESGRGFRLPLLVHMDSLAECADDYADAMAFLPQNAPRAARDKAPKFTLRQTQATLKMLSVITRSLQGFKLHIDVAEKSGAKVYIDMRAL